MSGSNMHGLLTGLLVLVVVAALVYLVDPTMFGLLKLSQGFANFANANSLGQAYPGQMNNSGMNDQMNVVNNMNAAPKRMPGNNLPLNNNLPVNQEGFENLASVDGPANLTDAAQPAGCYPRDELSARDLLPKDNNSQWAEQNPMGPGSLKGKNFLSAGALIGVNTVGQSLRNANWQLRSEPANPQVQVSIFNQSTIQPDINRRPLEIN